MGKLLSNVAFGLVALLIVLGLAPGAVAQPIGVPASRQADHYVVIPIDGKLDRFLTASVIRRLDQARLLGANAVVFEISARSSDFGTVSELLAAVRASPIPNMVAWIKEDALGGAGLVALTCREIVVSDTGTLGELVDPDWLRSRGGRRGPRGPGVPSGGPSSPMVALDLAASTVAGAIESARKHGHDEFLVQALAVSEVELWLIENNATGQRICINEEEYQRLFNQPPPRQNAELAPRRPTPFLSSLPSTGVTPILSSSSGANLPGPPILPANAAVGALLSLQPPGTLPIESPPTHPTLTQADAGQWKLVRYASSGAGAATIRGNQMLDYGLASTLIRADTELDAFFGAKKSTRLEQSWAEHTARFLSHPVVQGILIAIFLISMFVELTHPGMVLPGLLAAIALGLIVGPSFIVGLGNWWSLIAVAVGVILLALELFVIPGFGIAGVFGLIILFVGLVFTFVPTGPAGMAFSTPESQEALARGVVTVLLSTVTAMFGIFFVVRRLGTLPLLQKYTLQSPAAGEVDEALFGAMSRDENPLLIGDEGVAMTPLRPAGRAMFGDDLVEVVAEGGYIPEGVKVRIVSTDRFKTAVEPLEPPDPLASEPAAGIPRGDPPAVS